MKGLKLSKTWNSVWSTITVWLRGVGAMAPCSGETFSLAALAAAVGEGAAAGAVVAAAATVGFAGVVVGTVVAAGAAAGAAWPPHATRSDPTSRPPLLAR